MKKRHKRKIRKFNPTRARRWTPPDTPTFLHFVSITADGQHSDVVTLEISPTP
jgi:hypothetical protein